MQAEAVAPDVVISARIEGRNGCAKEDLVFPLPGGDQKRNPYSLAPCEREGTMQSDVTMGSVRSASSGSEQNGLQKTNLVKVVDLYAFQLEVSREEAAVLNQVTERVKEAGMVWWAVEANRGSDWYLHPDMASSHPESPRTLVSQLSGSLSTFTGSGQLQKLIRKGIPPALRPKVWRAVSGVMKKRSTVPEGYYQDLIEAVQGRETPATRQIDHVWSIPPLSSRRAHIG